ncbi:Asparagine synthetase [gamma proteobacterium IMCC2047]|nr:Asparagine synthetase [gamma proteobacterium IMCC2047]
MPEFSEHNALSIDALSENLHSLISESVSESIGDETHFATFLSGGLDSSTVTGVACNLTDRAVDSYSIGFDAKEYDETPFARETARHFGSQHHEYYVTPEDIFSAVPKIAAAYDEPFGNSSAMPVYYCAKVAADNGVKLMLAGDGGDELFAGNTRYASQRHYQHYLTIPKVLRKVLFDHLINALPAKFPLATKAQNYIKQADMPLPDRMQIYNFLYRHDPLEIFDKDYLATIDTPMPLELLREQYHRPENASDLNRMLYLDWQFTLADNDLRKVSSMCELAGVDVAYPLITDRLMDFSCDIPSALKLNKGNLRYFFRYAMQEFLPQATLKKSKHGFGLPFGVWLKDYQPLHDLAYDSLEKLKSRHFFNPDFIDKVRRMHGSTHASYYGELIWIMMMLELWISSHQDNGNR